MAVVTSQSAPCVVAATPAELSARHDVEDPAWTAMAEPEDESSVDVSSTRTESSAVKPAPKPSFVAPKVWMVAFGVVLAMCAGVVDVVTMRGLAVFVSHVTGTVARVGMRIEGVTTGMNETWDLCHSVLLVVSFIFGSFLCGLVIPKNQVHFGGKSFYGVALLGNSCLLIAAGCVAPAQVVEDEGVTQARAVAAGCLATMACGLQNAMCTMHFGAVVRTTHVTGTATDIGSTAGRAVMILLRSGCKHRSASAIERVEILDDVMKLCVLLPIFGGFLCGTILGAFLHTAMGVHALFVPAMVTGITGFMYAFFRTQMKRQLKKLEESRLKEELDEMETAIQRAHTLLETVSQGKGRKGLNGLDELIGRSLRAVHDVEATVAELYGRSGSDTGVVDRSRTF